LFRPRIKKVLNDGHTKWHAGFKSDADYEEFRLRFYEEVKPAHRSWTRFALNHLPTPESLPSPCSALSLKLPPVLFVPINFADQFRLGEQGRHFLFDD